ncbi:MAG: hypothetical protein ABIS50_19820 [Luteolibacter sp.]|uniref:hypothetical protein n=1 Tax=Luteolibacter sp. TaxID=1962973 RepID=UPI0032648956
MKSNPRFVIGNKGFALIVTLSLMILLTVIAVGLLSLSSISLRATSRGDAMSKARANARLALMLAIGDLQRTAGPDSRITAPANLVNSKVAPGVTGVWKGWRPPSANPDYAAAKTGTGFLGYLMANPTPADAPDPSVLPTAAKIERLVGPGSVGSGNTANEMTAPVVELAGTKPKVAVGGVSWVILDEGVKSRIDLLPAKDANGIGEKITQAGAPSRNGFNAVTDLAFLKSDSKSARDKLSEVLPKLVSLNQSGLAGSGTSAIAPYFHDFSVDSLSVQADVANGGLKRDLSVLFDATNLPADYSTRFLYSNTSTPLGSSDPLWALYAGYAKIYRKTTALDNPSVGMKAVVPPGYATVGIADKTIGKPRYEPNMKTFRGAMLMPTVVRIDTVFSLCARDARGRATGDYPYDLHLMYLPVITLHNPYSVPLRFTNIQVEFADTPIGFEFLVNGQPASNSGLVALNDLYISAAGQKKNFVMQLTGSPTSTAEVVMGAGETRVFGKPFPPGWTFNDEFSGGANGKLMFDWQSNKTGGTGTPALTAPGIITDAKSGVGYDVDWLATGTRAPWLVARAKDGVILLRKEKDDLISVRYGPKSPATAKSEGYKFGVTVRLNGTTVGTTQVFYKDEGRLSSIVSEGTSPRFPDVRSFPETYPKSGRDAPITTASIYVPNSQAISGYVTPKAFAVFSLGVKTTKESYTLSRPVADTGLAMQMATCDFTTSSSQGSSPLEFALTPVRGGSAAIQTAGDKGFFFGGHGVINGSTAATLYEIPLAPLQSIAQLRHANGASIGSIPYVTYSVGESRAHPALPADLAIFKPDASRSVLDHSWLANDQLWDRYWFSTLATLEGTMYTGSSAAKINELATDFFNGSRHLPNQRNVPYIPSGRSAKDVAAAAVTVDGKQTAACMMTAGGFNVNSTSVAAWTSVLSGLADTGVPLASGADETVSSGAPFLRMRRPVLGQSGSPRDKLWNSYRSLTTAEIKLLAEKIVAEVRARGPFLSMAEFVNRRLGPPGDLSNKGALQSALDQSGVNAVMEDNARPVSPSDVGGFGWQNPGAVTPNTGTGAPGEISQGDILTSIGSFATVRSDTFRIRAYGDARDASGIIIARAYCEATVQRVPEYVDTAELPEAAAALPANINFGRQFKVIAFRWLTSGEI